MFDYVQRVVLMSSVYNATSAAQLYEGVYDITLVLPLHQAVQNLVSSMFQALLDVSFVKGHPPQAHPDRTHQSASKVHKNVVDMCAYLVGEELGPSLALAQLD